MSGARGPLRLVEMNTVTKETLTGTMADKVRGATVIDKPDAIKDNVELSEVWDWLIPKLLEAGLAANIDALTLELCVRHYVHAVQASDQLLKESLLVSGRDEFKKNPLEAVFRSESLAFLSYSKMLGLSFAARVRTRDPKSDGSEEGDNPYKTAQ